MSRGRAVWPLVLALALSASLHCGVVLGQDEPAPIGEPAPVPPPSPAASCLEELAASGAVFTPAPADDEPAPLPGCGLVEGVVVSRGPSGLLYRPPIRVSCAFARTLPAVERIVQTEANLHLGAPVDVVRVMGSYGCRTIQSARSPGRMSEHGVGNAIDVGEWWSRDVHAVVLRDFRRASPEGDFLRALAERLRASGALERLLDPDYDAAHRNHFHLEGHPLR